MVSHSGCSFQPIADRLNPVINAQNHVIGRKCGHDTPHNWGNPAPIILKCGCNQQRTVYQLGCQFNQNRQTVCKHGAELADFIPVFSKQIQEIQNSRIQDAAQFFFQITPCVCKLDNFPFRGLAHIFIQASPRFFNHLGNSCCRLHIGRSIRIFCTQSLHNLGLRGRAVDDSLLCVRKLEALFGHCIVSTSHNFAQTGCIVHQCRGVQRTAAAHTHCIIGQRIHHFGDCVCVGEVGCELCTGCNHRFIAVNAFSLNLGCLICNLIVSIHQRIRFGRNRNFNTGHIVLNAVNLIHRIRGICRNIHVNGIFCNGFFIQRIGKDAQQLHLTVQLGIIQGSGILDESDCLLNTGNAGVCSNHAGNRALQIVRNADTLGDSVVEGTLCADVIPDVGFRGSDALGKAHICLICSGNIHVIQCSIQVILRFKGLCQLSTHLFQCSVRRVGADIQRVVFNLLNTLLHGL